jgi:hypothetical protein
MPKHSGVSLSVFNGALPQEIYPTSRGGRRETLAGRIRADVQMLAPLQGSFMDVHEIPSP